MSIPNQRDPIRKIGENQRELFDRFSKLADGFTADDVINAGANILINALRQAYPTRDRAEARFNELFGKTKQLLMDHYDGTGRRKAGIFPFNQTIHAEFIIDKDKIEKH